jgi:hypothetical protein
MLILGGISKFGGTFIFGRSVKLGGISKLGGI